MQKVMFICLGNICRSPMAEFVLKQKVKELGLEDQVYITSGGTEGYHLGGPMHKGTSTLLDRYQIPREGFANSRIVKEDFAKMDYLIVMDDANLKDCEEIFGAKDASKLFKLTDLIPELGYSHVPDPWYTGDFDETYKLVIAGCDALLRKMGLVA